MVGEHRKEILDQSKTKNQLGKSPNSASLSDVKILLRLAEGNALLSLGLVPLPISSSPWQVSNSSLIQHLGITKTIQVSPFQLHVMASLDLHLGTTMTHVWPQWISLVSEANSITPFSIHDSKARTMWSKLPSSASSRGWNMGFPSN